jgi:myo-inositol-1(or 4)-monophosphatase
MRSSEQKRALACAVDAARAAGRVLRANLRESKKIHESSAHDIKLELDVQCQHLIEKRLRARYPDVSILGEEGTLGDDRAAARWVVDPIDGTVNFAHGIPHACVSIALQIQSPQAHVTEFQTVAGVVYDPFMDELWTALRGYAARMNGDLIRVSRHNSLAEAVVSTGFAKTTAHLEAGLPYFNELARRVRKIRIMGAAALGLTYVATGRFDAYVERGIRLWDIAAGGLIVECAGGEFWCEADAEPDAYRMIASNGRLRKTLPPLPPKPKSRSRP